MDQLSRTFSKIVLLLSLGEIRCHFLNWYCLWSKVKCLWSKVKPTMWRGTSKFVRNTNTYRTCIDLLHMKSKKLWMDGLNRSKVLESTCEAGQCVKLQTHHIYPHEHWGDACMKLKENILGFLKFTMADIVQC